MRAFALSLLVLLIVGLAGGKLSSQTAPTHAVSGAEYERWKKDLSNWGRWGKDDEIGALNLITPEKRKQAAGLVREGFSVSLAGDADTVQAVDNPNPYDVKMLAIGNDRIGVAYHGFAHTHLDSLAHINDNGVFYNGYKPDADAVLKGGHAKNSIHNVKNGIFTRGILMDIPRLKGVAYLEPGTPIYPEDLDAWEKKAGVKVASGDVVFVRTGRWALRAAKGPWNISNNSAGLYASCAKWLKTRDVAMLGSDAASDVMPSGVSGVNQPIHQLVLIAVGMPIFDNCDLEALSEAANQRQRWEFLITAAPLAVPG